MSSGELLPALFFTFKVNICLSFTNAVILQLWTEISVIPPNIVSFLGQNTCTDELPENWMPNAQYHGFHLYHNITYTTIYCSGIDCPGLARNDSCYKKFSHQPLSNCVSGQTGIVRDLCKYSCKNCGKY